MEKWYGKDLYRYKVMEGAKEVYKCVSVAEDQDDVVRQLEAICGRVGKSYWVYCNGERIGHLKGLKFVSGDKRVNSHKIKCRDTGEVYDDLADMVEKLGFDYKHCSYLVNRTTRYSYID